MTLLEIIILSIIQGLTEFLPISSSGHLAIMQTLFERWSNKVTENATLDILLHFGTLMATAIYFRRELFDLGRGFFYKARIEGSIFSGYERRILILIVVSLIPTGIIGLLIEPLFEEMLHSVILVGIMLGITALSLFLTKFSNPSRGLWEVRVRDALIVGTVQGLAVIPGLSRSGLTIATALILGWKREEAFRFSFLISMPAILGATLLQMIKIDFSNGTMMNYLSGMLLAGIVGYISLFFLRSIIIVKKFHIFSFYCLAAGAFAIIIALI
ncbi:MAG: undecaprenyl-diphosphate phosphatase [Acidobacteriota bacterium]